MPAQVADWSQVKATAIATGNLLDAAEHHGLKYEAVRQRASREKWPVGRRVHEQLKAAQEAANQQIMTVTRGAVTPVTSADAIQAAMADDSRETRLQGSRYARKAVTHAANLPADEALAQAGQVKHAMGVAATVHGWDVTSSLSQSVTVVNVAVLTQPPA